MRVTVEEATARSVYEAVRGKGDRNLQGRGA